MFVESAAISRRTRTAKLCGLREEARQILLENAHIFEVWRGLFPDSDLERVQSKGLPHRALIKVAGGIIPPLADRSGQIVPPGRVSGRRHWCRR